MLIGLLVSMTGDRVLQAEGDSHHRHRCGGHTPAVASTQRQ
jgi:hypothetical protein